MFGHKDKSQDENGNIGIQTQTFILRVWVTGRRGASIEWRGRIQHIQSGEVQYCQNWDTFIAYVEKVLSESQEA